MGKKYEIGTKQTVIGILYSLAFFVVGFIIIHSAFKALMWLGG